MSPFRISFEISRFYVDFTDSDGFAAWENDKAFTFVLSIPQHVAIVMLSYVYKLNSV